ncbi:MAG: cobalamin-dependent protein [Candidatus Coatesbacteria bacterium]|nr:cobalamin-dependent protein [Candidatus Coatesbacteria bacterium]
MSILLVQAYLGRFEPPIFPAGLNALGRYIALRTEHDVSVLDMNVHDQPYRALADSLQQKKPDLVGISLRNVDTTQYRDRFYYFEQIPQIADTIKQQRPGCCLVIGGPGFSIYSHEIMQAVPRIDFGIVSEGELAFPALLDNLDSPASVAGVLFRRDGQVQSAGPGELFDLSDYPDEAPYVIPVEPYRDVPFGVGVESSRGCAQKCIYCVYPFLNGPEVRLRPPEKIVDEVQMLVEQHGLKTFQFIAPVFNIPPAHCEAVCKEMIKRGLGQKIDWIGWFAERFLSKDLWYLALDAGCVEFAFSPDALTDSVLELLGKASRQKDIERTLAMARRDPRASVSYNFFISPPGERTSDFLKLLRFFLGAKLRLRSRCRVFASYIRIEPHTAIHKIAIEEGLLSTDETMLPVTQKGLKRLFYMNRRTSLLGRIFGAIYFVKKLIRRLLGRETGV